MAVSEHEMDAGKVRLSYAFIPKQRDPQFVSPPVEQVVGERHQLCGTQTTTPERPIWALHFLKPVLDGDGETFFTNGDDKILQRAWAREHDLRQSDLAEILLAQIEDHRTEIFYNTDPTRYDSSFVRRLPGCVKKTVCWRAAPSGNVDLSGYGMVTCNFPSILEDWRRKGCKAGYFHPAVDPEMEGYGNAERPIDILFVGGYSRHHSTRVKVLSLSRL